MGSAVVPGHRAIDVLGDLGDEESGEIRVEAADETGGYDSAGHQLVGGRRRLQAVGIIDVVLGS